MYPAKPAYNNSDAANRHVPLDNFAFPSDQMASANIHSNNNAVNPHFPMAFAGSSFKNQAVNPPFPNGPNPGNHFNNFNNNAGPQMGHFNALTLSQGPGGQSQYDGQQVKSIQQDKIKHIQQQRQKMKEFSTCNTKISVTADLMIQNIIGKVDKTKKTTPHLSPGQSPTTTPLPVLNTDDEFGDFVSFSASTNKPEKIDAKNEIIDPLSLQSIKAETTVQDINSMMLKYSDLSQLGQKKDKRKETKGTLTKLKPFHISPEKPKYGDVTSIPVSDNFPSWTFDINKVPYIYGEVLKHVSLRSGLVDPVKLQNVLLTSGLTPEVLSHIWSLVTPECDSTLKHWEFICILGLVALAQNGYQVASLDALKQVSVPPSPLLRVNTNQGTTVQESLQGFNDSCIQYQSSLDWLPPVYPPITPSHYPVVDHASQAGVTVPISTLSLLDQPLCEDQYDPKFVSYPADKTTMQSSLCTKKPKFQFSPEHTVGSRLANYNVITPASNKKDTLKNNIDNKMNDVQAECIEYSLPSASCVLSSQTSSLQSYLTVADDDEFSDFQSYLPSELSDHSTAQLSSSSYATAPTTFQAGEDKYSVLRELMGSHDKDVPGISQKDSEEDIFYDASPNLYLASAGAEVKMQSKEQSEDDDFGDFMAVRTNELASSCGDQQVGLSTASLGLNLNPDLLFGEIESKLCGLKLTGNPSLSGDDVQSICSLDLKISEDSFCVEQTTRKVELPSSFYFSHTSDKDRLAEETSSISQDDPMQNIAVDKYSAIREVATKGEDIHVTEWLKCLKSSLRLLNNVITTLGEAEEEVRKEAMTSSEGLKYLEYLDEVHLVVGKITLSCSNLGLCNDTLRGILDQIDVSWKKLTEILYYTEALFSDPPSYSNPQFSCDQTDDIALSCGVCLLAVSQKYSVSYSGRQYHPSCANFWLNCVDAILPALPKRELL